ncbi:MAG: MFS transporter [Rhodospirillum sp.]|nr:MFS transporter [Rhodospirillum sp.]MCF8487773.1 MFS transporter [Rhodospirillum sp.]
MSVTGPETRDPPPMTALRVFLPFAAGYYLSYVFRTVNAAIAPNLVADLTLDPAALGLLGSAYFFSFAGFQIPLGVMLDRFGPRRIQAAMLVLAAAGSWAFSQAASLEGLILARLLIGLGVSACLMASFKAFVLWFPKQRLPLINGFAMAAGGLGALSATAPAEALAASLGWRSIFSSLALLTLAITLVILLVVPDRKSDHAPESLSKALRALGTVFTSRMFWSITPLAVTSQAAMMSLQTLWAGPWLTSVAGLTPQDAAGVLFWVAVAMVGGFLGLGTLAERLSRKGIPPLAVGMTGAVIFMVVQAGLLFQPSGLGGIILWVLFGFFGTTGILFYAVLSQAFPIHLAGRVNAGINVLVFSSAFAAQAGVGFVIKAFPAPEGSPYAPMGFAVGMGLILALQVLALAWAALSRQSLGVALRRP